MKTNADTLRRQADIVARSDDPDTATALRWAADDIAELQAALATAEADEGPGTPIARLRGISEFAEARGLCKGIEAKAPELFLMEAFDAAEAKGTVSHETVQQVAVASAKVGHKQGLAAGVEALQEPTLDMIVAGDEAILRELNDHTFALKDETPALKCWQAMIRALRPPAESEAERDAKLVEVMISQTPWKDQQWARFALACAARAIRRGRHLSEREKLNNIADALENDPDATDDERKELAAIAQKIRDGFPPLSASEPAGAILPATAVILGPNTLSGTGEFCPPPTDAVGQAFDTNATRVAFWFRTWTEAQEFVRLARDSNDKA